MGCELYLSVKLLLRKQIYICVCVYIYICMTERQTDMKIINTKNQDSVCGTLVLQDRIRCQETFRENGCEG